MPPAAVVHHEGGVFTAGAQIRVVLLVDVGVGMGLLLAPAHHLLGQLRRHVEIQHARRGGQAELSVFIVKQPVEKRPPLPGGELRGLVDGVRRGVAVGDDETAALIERAPVLLIGCVAVDGVKRRRGVGVHVAGVAAERAAEIQADQGRGILAVARELEPPVRDTAPVQLAAQQRRLGRLAGTVRSLKYNQFSSHRSHPFRRHCTAIQCILSQFSPFVHDTSRKKGRASSDTRPFAWILTILLWPFSPFSPHRRS